MKRRTEILIALLIALIASGLVLTAVSIGAVQAALRASGCGG